MDSNDVLPLVTIVSPCYNHAKYVIESIESIRQQTYKNIEHIIIDDASTDNSVEIIEGWIKANEYPCTFIKHAQNTGISKTLNESIRLAKGVYWSPLATDDFIAPDRTEKFVAYLETHPDTDMVASDSFLVNDNSEKVLRDGSNSFLHAFLKVPDRLTVESFGTYDSLLYGNYMPGSLLVRTSAIQQIGGFPENLKMEDWDTWLRMSRNKKIDLINESLTYYRIHDSNAVSQHALMIEDTIRTLFRQYDYCRASDRIAVFQKVFDQLFNDYFSFKQNKAIRRLFLSKDLRFISLKSYVRLKLKKLNSKVK